MGIAVPSQLRKASHQLNMALIGYSLLVLPATAGLVLVAGPPPWPSTGMDPSSAETVSTRSTAFARRRGLLRLSLRLTMVPSVTDTELLSHPLDFQFSPLSLLAHGEPLSPARPQLLRLPRLTTLLPLASVRPTLMPTTVMVPTPLDMGLAMVMAVTARGLLTPRLMPTMAMEAIVDTDSPTEAMAVLATAMARGLLTPRLMRTMATEAMVDMVLATPLATVLATAMGAMARGLLTLRLMPTTAMEDMVLATPLATVLAMAMVVVARGQLTLRPMPTMAMVDTDSVMADTAMVVLATAMARGLLTPSLTMDTVELTPVTDMVDTDLVLAMVTASKQ